MAQSPAELAGPAWLIPIHTAPADPDGGAYGIWAAGPDYKVSFHDGFTFYPWLGADYPTNLPLSWRTESIEVGGLPVVDVTAAATRHHTDWRFEYRFAGVTEAYDVRADGVEQTFVLDAPPPGAGDLVITGVVSSGLRAAARPAEHAPIAFCDPSGRRLVEYGAALALDADGRSTAVPAGCDGERVWLRVAGSWLRTARYPVTIDPLTSRVWLYGAPSPAGGGQIVDSDAAFPVDYNKTDPHLALVVHSREFSGGDIDAYGVMMNHSLGNQRTIWTDITTSWSSIRPRCSHVGKQDLWVVALERLFTAGNSAVRTYIHRRSDLTLNGGTWVYLSTPSGLSHIRPDIGGSAEFNNSAPTCLVVYQKHITGSATGRVYGALLDPVAGTFGAEFSLERSPGTGVTQLNPSVITHAMGTMTFPWLVAWQERDALNPNDDWDLLVNRVRADGSRDQEALVGPYATSDAHATEPIVSGDWGHYLIAYARRRPLVAPAQIGYQRFDWDQSASSPTRMGERTQRVPMNYSARLHAVAFDLNTQSHWTIVFQNSSGSVSAIRVGHTGGTTEFATVHQFASGAGAGGAAYSWQAKDFLLTCGDNDLLYPLYGRYLTYPSDAQATRYGTSCNSGAGLVPSGDSYAGNGRFGLTVGFPRPLSSTNAFLLVAPLSGSWLIPGAGSCRVYLDSATMFVADSRFNVFHNEFFLLPLPDDPLVVGDPDVQVVYLFPGANPLGLESTNGVYVKVR